MPLLTSPSASAVLAGAAIVVAAALLVLVLRSAGERRRRLLAVARLGFAAFVLLVVLLTVSLDLGATGGVNLVPFETIRLQLDGLEPARAAWNLVGNLVLLVPFALLARAAWGWRVLATTVAGVALSVAVEVGQLFSGRSADVDDVLVNGLGVLLGAVLADVLVRIARRPAGPPRRRDHEDDDHEDGDEARLSVPTPRSAGSP